MSMNRSLKGASGLVRHRNVLTRAERMARLEEEEKWPAGRSIFGLPKVANRKLELGKADKEEAAEGDAAVAGAVATAPAAGAKAAAPAAGAKAAAPAAKGAAAPAAPAAKKK